LNTFGLPWDWEDGDENSDYLLIKQYIDEDLQDELFEHTRQLRRHNRHGRQDNYRNHYTPPRCFKTGAALSSDVNLKLPVSKGQALAVKPVSASDDDSASGRINVSFSRINGDGGVALYRKDASMDYQVTQFSWMWV
jgi:hypothetical protein